MITYTCYMKNKKNLTNQQKIARVIGSLSANQSYFLVHTNSMLHPDMNKHTDRDLMLLIYRNDDSMSMQTIVRAFVNNVSKASLLMQEVRKDYQNSHHKYKLTFEEYLEKSAMFQLQKGFVLENSETIKDVKRYLRTQCLDGTKLYLKIYHPMDSNQCGAWTVLHNESAFNQGAIEVPFILKPLNYSLYIPIKFDLTVQDIEMLLLKQIQLIFGKTINQKDLKIRYYFQGEWCQLKKYHILSLCSSDKLEVEVNETFLQLPEYENSNYLILKGQGISVKILEYELIKNKKVIDLLTEIEPKRSWNDYGLMIGDFPLKSYDRIEKVACMFIRSKVHSKHIAGVIIKEMHVFELELEKIKKIGKVDMKRIVYDEKTNHEHEKTCERQIEKRAKETTLDSFKHDLGGIKPILLYTSELKVCATAKGMVSSPASMYFVLNEFLRKQNVCSAKDEDFHQWEYMFGCQLLQQLRKIPTISDQILWRGVSYEPAYKLNEVILFKQFTSSSTSQSAAKQFADKAMFKIVKSYSGRCIKEFSFYKYEDQILFEPYTYFQVVGIQKYQNQEHNIIPCFVLEEVKKQEIPKNIVRIVLWVDDKTAQGKHLWSSIKGIRSTTLMVQLLSTQDLEKWFQRNKDVLLDPAVEIVMITNMTRKQKGVVNGEAGIEAVKIFKRLNPEGDIFFFIGWREGTIKKLEKYLLYPDQHIQVSEYVQDLEDFIKQKCIET